MTSPTNLTSSIQVTPEMIEAGRSVFRYGHLVPVEAIYLAMRSKDHSIAVDDVRERVALAICDAVSERSCFSGKADIVRCYGPHADAAITAIGSQSK